MATVALGMGLLAACGGQATATPPSTTTATTTAGPVRPKIINLVGKSPCGLIPQSDVTRFEWDKAPKAEAESTLQSPLCSYDANWGLGSIALDDHDGISEWTHGKYGNGTTRPTDPVLGFQAIDALSPDSHICDVVVDVAPGQALDAYIEIDGVSPVSDPCTFAHQWAEAAMSTLLS
ncbi:MAG TPA: DUF3558 domain-containing protein [Pseudonocardiaceae bacterium]|nr:DUF3558 domain-containing protein [Pseudonocardiaceae bacterium]